MGAMVAAAEAKAAKLAVRAATAEAQVDEQRGELRRLSLELDRLRSQFQREQKDSAAESKRLQIQHAAELDRAWAQLQREQSHHAAEQEARKHRSTEHDARSK